MPTPVTLESLEARSCPVVGAFSEAALVAPGTGFDGVVAITNPDGSTCSGVLLYTGRHILTTAHCVDADGDGVADGPVQVRFDMPGVAIEVDVPANAAYLAEAGEDIALLGLPVLAPSGPSGQGAERYDLYRAFDEVGQDFQLVGYGQSGTGLSGSQSGSAGIKRSGWNRFDADELNLGGPVVTPGLGLLADFDSGEAAHDAFDVHAGIWDRGLGEDEAAIGLGDSGGPAFLLRDDGYAVAGIATFFMSGQAADVDPTFGRPTLDNQSFGDVFGYTRVAAFADSIDAVLAEPHDLVIDMFGQMPGNDGQDDGIDVYLDGQQLAIAVNGELLHADDLGLIRSLTIRGSDDVDDVLIDASVPTSLSVEVTDVEDQDDQRQGSPVLPAPAPLPGQLFPGPAPLTPTLSGTVFVTGAGSGGMPMATMLDHEADVRLEGMAYAADFRGGVRVASGDCTGDGVPDLITGSGPGAAPLIQVFDGASGQLVDRFFAYEESYQGGVLLAAGDMNRDGFVDILVSPDQGGGPRIRIFDGRTGMVTADFFGIDDANFRGGARVGLGDVNADGFLDLAVGAGYGGGPRVALFDGKAMVTQNQGVKLVADFFVFEPSLRNGVYLTVGDLDGDGFGDLIAAGGPGGGPRVLGLHGPSLLAGDGQMHVPMVNFFVEDPQSRGGVRIIAKDLDGDRLADLVTGSGEGEPPMVHLYRGWDLKTQASPEPLDAFMAYDWGFGGVFVG